MAAPPAESKSEARLILEKVAAKYKTIKTFKAEGTIVPDIDSGRKRETSFSILLKKPNLYLISWVNEMMPKSDFVQSGAVWSDGTQPYLHVGWKSYYSRIISDEPDEITSDERALAGATGISHGAAHTIPSLFLPVFEDEFPFLFRLKDPIIEKTEQVGDDDYYVISGATEYSKKETLWISRTSHLIWKYSQSFELPEGGKPIPEMTEEEFEEGIERLGSEVTEECKKKMREGFRTRPKTREYKGSSTEFYENISCPELTKSDFRFALPEGTILRNSS